VALRRWSGNLKKEFFEAIQGLVIRKFDQINLQQTFQRICQFHKSKRNNNKQNYSTIFWRRVEIAYCHWVVMTYACEQNQGVNAIIGCIGREEKVSFNFA